MAIALAVITLYLVSIFIGLSLYTHHGDSYAVPDFKGLTESQFKEVISQKGFRYTIIDSVHVQNLTPGSVVEQMPEPGALVKKNRTIHFTINALTAEKVQIPNLVDYSLRNAKVILESFGLKVGELIYAPSEYTNLVLGQHFEGKPVAAGTPVLKGSVIDLVIGHGLSSQRTNIPDLKGLSIYEAKQICQSTSLNIGAVMFDSGILSAEDTTMAFVWKQYPMPEEGSRLQLGSSIEIWLRLDSTKIRPDTLYVLPTDF